jgi:catechol 2,3-dioxygenase-like lactoylglutathione lyase family enzyme
MGEAMVKRIGHVGLRVRDLDRSVAFAEDILGLRETERDGTTSYLTCNSRHHELVLIEADEPGCDHLGFEVADERALDAARERVSAEGLTLVSEAAVERGIAAAFRFLAPGGFVFELFCGMAHDQPAEYPTVGARPSKFEHITIKSSCKDEMEDLLIRVLGFRLSDRAEKRVSWLRASQEHHGMSVMADEVDQLQHYAWQLPAFADIKTVGDRLMATRRSFLWGPGHHGIGDNYFCYFFDDDGVIVEYSAEIQRIENDADWVARTWPDEALSVNRWGNPAPPQAFVDGGVDALSPLGVVGAE